MLNTIRENLKYLSWVLWIVIAAFIAALFFDFGAIAGGGATGDVVAHAAGVPITQEELREQLRQLDQRYRQMFGQQWSSELAEQLGLERQAIEVLVNRKVLLHEAEQLGLAVSDDELAEAIRDIPAFQEDGRFIGSARYAEVLRLNGLTAARFEQDLRQSLLLEKLQQVMAQNVYVSDAAVEQALREEAERASIAYLELPAAQLGNVTASREELERFLAENPEQFRVPAQRRVAYLLVDQNRVAQEVAPTDAELQAFYRQNEAEFSTEEQVQARHILLRTGGDRTADQARQELEAAKARLAAGEDFAALVRELSEEPGAGERGGDLGWFGRGAMVPEFEQAAFGAEVGEIVGPIETPFGVHILEVTGRREGGVRPFAEVRPEIVQRLRGEQAEGRARQVAVELAAELREGEATVEEMQALAEARPTVEMQQPAPFGENGFVPGLGRVPELSQAAFTLEAGSVSDPIQVPRGWAVMLVQEALEPRVPELDEAEPRVRALVEQRKRQEAAVARLEEAKAGLGEGRTLEDVAAELGLSVQQTGEFAATGTIEGLGYVPEVAQAAMRLSAGEIGGPVATPQGAVLFRVASRQTYDPATAAPRREEVRARLVQERLQQLQAALIQHRREELGVTYSRQLAETLQGGAQEG